MPGRWEHRFVTMPLERSYDYGNAASVSSTARITPVWVEDPPCFGRSEFRDPGEMAAWASDHLRRWGSVRAWEDDQRRARMRSMRDDFVDLWTTPFTPLAHTRFLQEFTANMPIRTPIIESPKAENGELDLYMRREDLYNRSYIAIWSADTVQYWRIRGHISGVTLARVLSRYYATQDRVDLLTRGKHEIKGASFLSPAEVFEYNETVTRHVTTAWNGATNSINGWRMFMWKDNKWFRRVDADPCWKVVDPHGIFEE